METAQKKSPVVGAILGFFIIGLFYTGNMKRALFAFIGLCCLSTAIAACISPWLSIIANAIGAYLGHTWIKQYNAVIDDPSANLPVE